MSCYDIGCTDWRVLFNIGQYGPLSAVHVSQRTSIEKTKISRAVQRLVTQGWVERIYVEGDRRRHELALTAEGRSNFLSLRQQAALFNKTLETRLAKGSVAALIEQRQHLEADTESD